jgi:hypothetical protein
VRTGLKADRNESFKKIPKTFGELVVKRGVFEATRMMAVLLFGEK